MKNLKCLMAIGIVALAPAAHAAYPEQPIRLVVPFSAGGNIDATARIVAKDMAAKLGQAVVVENRGGAAGLVGAQAVARANPDGYTSLLASTGSLAAMRALDPNIALDPEKDFESAGPISTAAMMLVIKPSLPINNLAEFIAYAKANPEKLTMGSAGTGTSNHLAGVLFQNLSDTKFLHVPYKGSGPAMADLLGGQIDIMFDQMASSLPLVKAGKLRALGVTTATRSTLLPDLPTITESGLKGYEASTTTGILFPKGTPKEVTEKVNEALNVALRNQAVRDQFLQMGAEIRPGSAQDFQDLLSSETKKWSEVVKAGGITK